MTTNATPDLGQPTYPVPPKVGDRVRLRHDVDRYPHFLAVAGSVGTVTESCADEISDLIVLRMDEHLAGAEEWKNSILWTSDDDQSAAAEGRECYAAVPFWEDCERIGAEV